MNMELIHIYIMHRFMKNSNIAKCIQSYAINYIMPF